MGSAGETKSRFVIAAADVEAMAAESGKDVPDLLRHLAVSAKSLARPTISDYHVGAAALAADGRVFLGANLEFPGVPLHQSVHAEQFAAANAVLHSAPSLSLIAVSSVPCGHCRQFLQELRSGPALLVSAADSAVNFAEYAPLADLLPRRFGPNDLLPAGAPLLLEPRDNGIGSWLRRPMDGAAGPAEELRVAAAAAANAAHSPYTGCPSGAAVADRAGRVYAGGYVESAAYNPGLGPVQAAVVAFIAGGGGDYSEIAAAAVVEKEGAAAAQEGTARLLVEAISPGCEFYCFKFPPPPKKSPSEI